MDQDTHRNVAPPEPAAPSDQAGERVETLRSDMEQTRENIGETLQAIEERLSPGNLASDAVSAVRTSASRKMEHMMTTATERMGDVADRTRDLAGSVAERAGTTPWPAILIGAGIGYLLYRTYGEDGARSSTSRHESGYSRGYGSGRGVPYSSGESSRRPGQSYAGDMVERRREQIANVGRQASAFASRGARMVCDNPLGFGIAAMAVGAAVGLSAPETEAENEWLGETRDALVDRAKEMAGVQAESASTPAMPGGRGGTA